MKPRAPKTPPTTDPSTPPTPPSEFSFTLTKIAVSQICQSTGFKGATSSALHTLTQVATLYLRHLSTSAAAFSAASGRTHSNLFDVVPALELLAAVNGFKGGSAANECLLLSTALLDIAEFVNSSDEIPFARPVPRRQELKRLDSKLNNRGASRLPHVPKWLPPFPDTLDEIQFVRWRGNGRRGDSGDGFAVDSCNVGVSGVKIESLSGLGNGCDLGAIGDCERMGDSSVKIESWRELRNGCGMELGEEREKVRFKIGGGVWRGGKRVCWDGGIGEGEDGKGEKKSKSKGR